LEPITRGYEGTPVLFLTLGWIRKNEFMAFEKTLLWKVCDTDKENITGGEENCIMKSFVIVAYELF
jgi:hypothetical protein